MLVDAYAEVAPCARPGLIVLVQTFGNLANVIPHVRVLAADGAFRPDETFVPLPAVPEWLLAEGVRRAVLDFLAENDATFGELRLRLRRLEGWINRRHGR